MQGMCIIGRVDGTAIIRLHFDFLFVTKKDQGHDLHSSHSAGGRICVEIISPTSKDK